MSQLTLPRSREIRQDGQSEHSLRRLPAWHVLHNISGATYMALYDSGTPLPNAAVCIFPQI
jgi:hypothetical protein